VGSSKTYTVTRWQVGLLKVSLIALGILIGSTWHDFFDRWIAVVWTVFLLTAACRAYFWWRLPVAAPGGTERGGFPAGNRDIQGVRAEQVAAADRPRE
jgi:general stress protein CsbA